jgi:hypothetical protein
MYSVDERDEVVEIQHVPQSSIGAPLPVVVADERRLFLAYIVEAIDPEWDARTVRVIGADTAGELVALVQFTRARAHFFGPPNDEAFTGHPLAERGLHPYGAFEIRHSSWIRRLEQMNAVHPNHKPSAYAQLRHFVFAFHDSTFECVASEFSFEVREGSLASAARELAERLGA